MTNVSVTYRESLLLIRDLLRDSLLLSDLKKKELVGPKTSSHSWESAWVKPSTELVKFRPRIERLRPDLTTISPRGYEDLVKAMDDFEKDVQSPSLEQYSEIERCCTIILDAIERLKQNATSSPGCCGRK